MNDREVVRAQLGRPPRSAVDVAARCHLGLPVVIAVPPFLEDGTPFPTLYWLTCPLARKRVGRVESHGGVKAAEARIDDDRQFAARHAGAMERYEAERDALIPAGETGPVPEGGVGGARFGVKCLHAHYADHHRGSDNPVGQWTAVEVDPLNCLVPCVIEEGGVTARNPAWREPQR